MKLAKANIVFYVCPYFRLYRFAEYKNFIKWVHSRLGKGVRKVIPSSRFMEYSQKYPSDDGSYIPFKGRNETEARELYGDN